MHYASSIILILNHEHTNDFSMLVITAQIIMNEGCEEQTSLFHTREDEVSDIGRCHLWMELKRQNVMAVDNHFLLCGAGCGETDARNWDIDHAVLVALQQIQLRHSVKSTVQ